MSDGTLSPDNCTRPGTTSASSFYPRINRKQIVAVAQTEGAQTRACDSDTLSLLAPEPSELPLVSPSKANRMLVFTSNRLQNKAQGRRFGAPWVNGPRISVPRSGYTTRELPLVSLLKANRMRVFTLKRLQNKAQGRCFGAPWVNSCPTFVTAKRLHNMRIASRFIIKKQIECWSLPRRGCRTKPRVAASAHPG